jgi:hypothetical protein
MFAGEGEESDYMIAGMVFTGFPLMVGLELELWDHFKGVTSSMVGPDEKI